MIKRWKLYFDGHDMCGMDEVSPNDPDYDDGYILAEDHLKEVERLKSEIEEGNVLLQKRKKQKDELYRKVGEMICENSELQAEVERLKGGVNEAIADLDRYFERASWDGVEWVINDLRELIGEPPGDV